LLVAGALVVCSSCDEGSDRSDTAAAWCAQLDELYVVTTRLEELDADSPAFADAMAALDDQVQTLDDLATPDAIADDWVILRAPPTTDPTGRIGIDGEQQDAGERVAGWALDHCELSSAARAGLDGSS
jgi:hypothetical protein